MGDVVLTMFTSLDGYIAGPGGAFVAPDWSDDMQHLWSDRALDRAGVLIYGRVNYEFNAGFWTGAARGGGGDGASAAFAHRMNAMPKIVLTGHPRRAGWNATMTDDIAGAIRDRRAAQSKDLVAFGGAGLAQTLLRLDLVDRLRLMSIPQIFGDGIPLFAPGIPARRLDRVETVTTDTGGVITEYRMAAAPGPGA